MVKLVLHLAVQPRNSHLPSQQTNTLMPQRQPATKAQPSRRQTLALTNKSRSHRSRHHDGIKAKSEAVLDVQVSRHPNFRAMDGPHWTNEARSWEASRRLGTNGRRSGFVYLIRQQTPSRVPVRRGLIGYETLLHICFTWYRSNQFPLVYRIAAHAW